MPQIRTASVGLCSRRQSIGWIKASFTGLALSLGLLCTPRAAELVVAQVLPLSGFDGGTGWHMQLGAQVAVAEANADHVLGSHSLRLETVDEKRGQVPDQVRQLVARFEPVALLGLYGRAGLRELSDSRLMSELALPVLGVNTGTVQGVGIGSPWLFLTRGSYADEVDSVFRHLVTVASRRVALLTTDDEDGQEIRTLVEKSAKASGVTIVSVHAHPPGGVQVAAAAQAILEQAPDAVILASNTSAVANFAKLHVRGGGKAQMIALSSAEATQLAAVVGADAARGVLISQMVPNPRDPKLGLMREFMAAFKRFGPEGKSPSLVMTESYIATRVLIEALRRSGPRPDGANLLRTLAGLPSPLVISGFPVSLNRKGQAFRSLSMIGRDGNLIY